MKYVCANCSKNTTVNKILWRCECGGMLSLSFSPAKGELLHRGTHRGIWKYKHLLLPPFIDSCLTLGEGDSPLLQQEWNSAQVQIKWEADMPTGSYKDRGASVLISVLKHLGVKDIVEDSSGNAGAAIAWYAGIAGIRCHIVAPLHTTPEKLNSIRASGATLHLVDGSREKSTEAALKMSEGFYYASHVWVPFFSEGIKSIAYELFDQTDGLLPARIFLPAGNGSLLLGLGKGLLELFHAGLIPQLPRLIAVQAANCAPLHARIHGLKNYLPKPTRAEGIAASNPLRLKEMQELLERCNGQTRVVSEEEIKIALEKAEQKGWMIEPTSAAVLAALSQEMTEDNPVVIVTGSSKKKR